MKRIVFKDLNVGVLGLGRSGISAANLAARLGANVLASDNRSLRELKPNLKTLNRSVRVETGGHTDALLSQDIIIKSPGIPPRVKILEKIMKKGLPVWSEIELALRAARPGRLIAITGTNGKTTTTTLTGEIFRKARKRTVVAGNIGAPLADFALCLNKSTFAVLEISSYQLENTPSLHPSVSVILNITPDHLEHHDTMKRYVDAKAEIFRGQTKNDFCVLNYDDVFCRRLAKRSPASVIFFSRRTALEQGVFSYHGAIRVRIGKINFDIEPKLKIRGNHNLENALAATAACAVSGIRPSVIEKALSEFSGVEHRLEFVAGINGAMYVNDSKGTNVDSTRVALESFSEPVWLIMGGRDKGAPYRPLIKLIKAGVKGILLIGEAARSIRSELKGSAPMYDCGTMGSAVKKAAGLASPGDVVLLSPACASFDQFQNYEQRGKYFKKLVMNLKKHA